MRVAIAAIALSIAVMLIGISLIKGFQEGVQDKFYNSWGHIHITPYLADPNHYLQEEQVAFNDTLFQKLKLYENVAGVQPFALQSVILKSKHEMEGVVLKSQFQHYTSILPLVAGKAIRFNDSSYSQDIIMSQSLANRLEVHIGDPIRMYFLLPGQTRPKPRKAILSGIYHSGLQEYDNQIVYCDQKLLENIKNDSLNMIQGYEIIVKDKKYIQQTKDKIYQDLIEPPLYAYTLKDRFANIFSWLGMMKTNEQLIITIMMIVAIMNMISTMLILILERTQMIGILKTLGMKNNSISHIFYYSGLRILAIGMLIGNIIGLIIITLQRQFGFIKMDPEVYYVRIAPAIYAWPSFLFINLLVVVVMLFILLVPTLLIRRINPVKAIQFQ